MPRRAPNLTLVFSSLGHGLMHMLTAFYFVIVLALEREWGRPYHELIELWTLGALLVGLCAIPAGWLADRWNAPAMMVVMFIGMGLACFACASAETPAQLLAALAGLGVFAAIYHPVGIPWVVRNATSSGRALGINGIFGGLGVAAAGAVSGLLIDLFSWRAAFAVPGAVSLLSGAALWFYIRAGRVSERELEEVESSPGDRGDVVRTFVVLLLTMFCLGLIYQASQTALPKVFDVRLGALVGEGALGVGLLVSVVYAVAALMQLVGGHLADRCPLRPLYFSSFLVQVPVLAAVAVASGLPLVLAATLSVLLSTGALSAENMLLARYSPRRHQGLIFGIKFVLAFGTAPLAIWFVAWVNRETGDFTWLFAVLAGFALVAFAAALGLPRQRGRPVAPARTG